MELSKCFFFSFLVILAIISDLVTGSRVVCYYPNWSPFYMTNERQFSPENIDTDLCTHLIYVFGVFSDDAITVSYSERDIRNDGYSSFNNLKMANPELKTLLAVGGEPEDSNYLSSMSASLDRRKKFIMEIIQFLRENVFDGIDLNWKYPESRDKKNYVHLVQEMSEEFKKEAESTNKSRLLLTMGVPAIIDDVQKGYDLSKLSSYLDWMNMLSFDYHFAIEQTVNHHSPLYALVEGDDLNINSSINYFLQAGVDSRKLVLGIPIYGRSFTLVNPAMTDIGSPSNGPGNEGNSSAERGYLAYNEICEMKFLNNSMSTVDKEAWKIVKVNSDAMGPYAYRGDQWVGYDDVDIVQKKAQFAAEKKLGGIMFWAIDNDDFRGKCHGKPYPIINAAKEAFLNSLNEEQQNLGNTPSPRPIVIQEEETSFAPIESTMTQRTNPPLDVTQKSTSAPLSSTQSTEAPSATADRTAVFYIQDSSSENSSSGESQESMKGPQEIKQLISLINKIGGVDQLYKYLTTKKEHITTPQRFKGVAPTETTEDSKFAVDSKTQTIGQDSGHAITNIFICLNCHNYTVYN